MKIVSKFHDYYDSALGYGIDKECVFNRKTENLDYQSPVFVGFLRSICEFDSNKYNKHFTGKNTRTYFSSGDLRVTPYLIGFCGKLIPAIEIKDMNPDFRSGLYRKTFIYSAEQMESFFEKNTQHQKIKSRYDEKRNPRYSVFADTFTSTNVNDFFDYYKATEVPVEVFSNIGAPYFIAELCQTERELDEPKQNRYIESIVINPSLKDIKFFQEIDSFTAFQEISMFLSGVIGSNENNMITISDKDKRDAKGFDNQSFKKRKEK